MAVNNQFSNVYLADSGGANRVYFDVDPTPFPVFDPRKFGAIKRTVPTRNSSTNSIAPGTTVAFDAGSDISSSVLEISVQYMLASTFVQIFQKFTATSQVQYSPDNGQTVYLCQFMPGPLGLSKPPGWLNYAGKLRLQVLSQSVGSGGVGGPGGGG